MNRRGEIKKEWPLPDLSIQSQMQALTSRPMNVLPTSSVVNVQEFALSHGSFTLQAASHAFAT